MKKSFLITCFLSLLICSNFLLAQDDSISGGMYEGDRKGNGKRHGRGTYTWEDGTQYSGRWRNDLMDGIGTMKWLNGAKYSGEWRLGRKHGRGTFTWPNGDRYSGDWVYGQQEGEGKLIMANGTTHKGDWENGMANGSGTRTWPDSSRFQGNWKNDKMHGQGVLMEADGKVKMGEWKNGDYIPCQCSRTSFPPEEALRKYDGVFLGVVTQIYPGEDRYTAELEVLRYWKGSILPGRKILLASGFSSCDLVLLQGQTYLIYADRDYSGLYKTTKCSRSANILDVQNDIQILNETVECENGDASGVPFDSANDPVCGCDGKTYRNPHRAQKSGVQIWEIGECPEG